MGAIHISSENYERTIKTEKTVLLDFYAEWCGPCKMMSPVIDQIAEEVGNTVIVGKIDVDDDQQLAEKYGIMSIPTIVIIKNGEVVKKFVGVTNKEEILEALK